MKSRALAQFFSQVALEPNTVVFSMTVNVSRKLSPRAQVSRLTNSISTLLHKGGKQKKHAKPLGIASGLQVCLKTNSMHSPCLSQVPNAHVTVRTTGQALGVSNCKGLSLRASHALLQGFAKQAQCFQHSSQGTEPNVMPCQNITPCQTCQVLAMPKQSSRSDMQL